MRYRFYSENARQQSKVSALLTPSIIVYIFIGVFFFTGILILNVFAAAFFGLLTLGFIVKYFRDIIHRRTVFLQFSENGIIYFCEERNEIVYILSRDIVKIHTSLCRIEVFTRDGFIHTINLLNIESKETRWEINEITRTLAKEVSCELAA